MLNLNSDNISKLLEFYKNKGGITLVGLNDSQLINVTNPWGKGSFDLLVDTFEKEGIYTTSLNAGSSFYNKAEHAKAIVENDLTVKEIQLLNSFSYLEAYSKVLRDIGLPFGVPRIFERAIRSSFDDKVLWNLKISDLLIDNPIIITSFMANNIMRAVANNPWKITSDYKQRYKRANFDYTLAKTKDCKVLEEIIETTKQTYDTILSRTNGQIYGIGFFLPKGMAKEEGLRVFEEFVNRCNDSYSSLCKTLGVHYVDISSLGSTTGNIDFHASPMQIKNAVLAKMADNIGKEHNSYISINESKSSGLDGVMKGAYQNLRRAQVAFEKDPDDIVAINTINERDIELDIAENAKCAYKRYLDKKASKRIR